MTASVDLEALRARAWGCEYRMGTENNTDPTSGDAIDARLFTQAADEIERLRAALTAANSIAQGAVEDARQGDIFDRFAVTHSAVLGLAGLLNAALGEAR